MGAAKTGNAVAQDKEKKREHHISASFPAFTSTGGASFMYVHAAAHMQASKQEPCSSPPPSLILRSVGSFPGPTSPLSFTMEGGRGSSAVPRLRPCQRGRGLLLLSQHTRTGVGTRMEDDRGGKRKEDGAEQKHAPPSYPHPSPPPFACMSSMRARSYILREPSTRCTVSLHFVHAPLPAAVQSRLGKTDHTIIEFFSFYILSYGE